VCIQTHRLIEGIYELCRSDGHHTKDYNDRSGVRKTTRRDTQAHSTFTFKTGNIDARQPSLCRHDVLCRTGTAIVCAIYMNVPPERQQMWNYHVMRSGAFVCKMVSSSHTRNFPQY
jgi:hypothetical protein